MLKSIPRTLFIFYLLFWRSKLRNEAWAIENKIFKQMEKEKEKEKEREREKEKEKEKKKTKKENLIIRRKEDEE